MKVVVQSVRSGTVSVTEVPAPKPGPGQVLVRVASSLISAGTERFVMEFAGKSMIEKARARPDLVRQVYEKAKREGIAGTFESLQEKLDKPLTLGYSNAGIVVETGQDVEGFKPGDRVACAGANYAIHAEMVVVPRNLVVPIDDRVDFDSAAFVTLGAIAMQGFRLAGAQVGETVAVIGLGLLGQIAVGIAKAAGCLVVGMDLKSDRAELARDFGAAAVASTAGDLAAAVDRISQHRGADAVLITADTPSSAPAELAGTIARDRGSVVCVGNTGLDLPRKLYFEKELAFRVSRSYGPGRYDAQYEEKGIDYPIGFVRWTEKRNMESFARLLAVGAIPVDRLVTHRFPIDEAAKAYDIITGAAGERFLAVLIQYAREEATSRVVEIPRSSHRAAAPGDVSIGVIGAGNFAASTLLPAIKADPETRLTGICSAAGLSARHSADRFGFKYCTTDEGALLDDPAVNTVVIATRHNLHARQVVAALQRGKHVFCEKPLCLNAAELADISRAYPGARPAAGGNALLMVGFNRRFAPMARRLKAAFADVREPLMMHYRINAGYVPRDHWIHDPGQGGGRIIGEVCHFIDFMIYLAGNLPAKVQAFALDDCGKYSGDNVQITLSFEGGSVGSIAYVANGDKSYPKERVEVYGGGAVGVLHDFRMLELVRGGRRTAVRNRLRQDKGHRAEWEHFARAIRSGGEAPIPWRELVAGSMAAFAAAKSAHDGAAVEIRPGDPAALSPAPDAL